MLLVTFTTALTDCQNLKQFALGLNMHLTNPTIMNEINNNCCTGIVTGVTCTVGVITRISWRFLGLNGIFTANLPSQLQYIDLEGNSIIGNLPTTGYPPTLNQFKVPYNKFNGTIPSFPDSVDQFILGKQSIYRIQCTTIQFDIFECHFKSNFRFISPSFAKWSTIFRIR
eukprot:NODE_1435_length_1064_cov_0.223834.p1 type:complete len:170 gc:universal NODE_1435_length_1064_cov_0.223834:980-471(-)